MGRPVLYGTTANVWYSNLVKIQRKGYEARGEVPGQRLMILLGAGGHPGLTRCKGVTHKSSSKPSGGTSNLPFNWDFLSPAPAAGMLENKRGEKDFGSWQFLLKGKRSSLFKMSKREIIFHVKKKFALSRTYSRPKKVLHSLKCNANLICLILKCPMLRAFQTTS